MPISQDAYRDFGGAAFCACSLATGPCCRANAGRGQWLPQGGEI